MIHELKNDITLSKLLKGDRPKLVYFGASWCVPCKNIKPVIEQLSEQIEQIDFYKADIDVCENIVDELKITSIPIIYFINNETINNKIIGGNIDKIKETINEYIK